MHAPLRRREFLSSASLGFSAAMLAAARGTAAAPPETTRGLTRKEQEQFLLTAEIIKTRTLSEGITNSERATLTDGVLTHDAHIQTIDEYKQVYTTISGTYLNFADTFQHNLAAYALDQLLNMGMIPASVERKVAGELASVTWWVDDVLMSEKERYLKKIEPPNQEGWNQQIYCVRAFDELIYNFDRNLGNLVITKDWRVWMIDHTRSFLPYKELNNKERLVKCDRHLLEGMRRLTPDKIEEALDRYLNNLRMEGILARRDLIVAHFDKAVKERGEERILYDCLPFDTVVEVPVSGKS